MYHPITLYMLASQDIAEKQRQADKDRVVRQIREGRLVGTIDATPFRARVSRLFGGVPRLGHSARPTAAR